MCFRDPYGLEKISGESKLKEIRYNIDAAQTLSYPDDVIALIGLGCLNHGGAMDFDFKVNGYGDTWVVDELKMQDDEFGNFCAGYYAGYSDYPRLMYGGVRTGGVIYALGDNILNVLKFWGSLFRKPAKLPIIQKTDDIFDSESVPAIDNGFNRGKKDREKYR